MEDSREVVDRGSVADQEIMKVSLILPLLRELNLGT